MRQRDRRHSRHRRRQRIRPERTGGAQRIGRVAGVVGRIQPRRQVADARGNALAASSGRRASCIAVSYSQAWPTPGCRRAVPHPLLLARRQVVRILRPEAAAGQLGAGGRQRSRLPPWPLTISKRRSKPAACTLSATSVTIARKVDSDSVMVPGHAVMRREAEGRRRQHQDVRRRAALGGAIAMRYADSVSVSTGRWSPCCSQADGQHRERAGIAGRGDLGAGQRPPIMRAAPLLGHRCHPALFRSSSSTLSARSSVVCGWRVRPARRSSAHSSSTSSPALHHADGRAEMRDDGQVVADQHVGEPVRLPADPQQVEHLGLDRDVQRAGRFVQQQHLRLRHQRPRDGHALALAAGELVRIAEAAGGSATSSSARGSAARSPIPCTSSGSLSSAVDGLARMQRTVRVLEHHLHPAKEIACRGAASGLAIHRHAAGPIRVQAGQRAQDGGLARARFRPRGRSCRPRGTVKETPFTASVRPNRTRRSVDLDHGSSHAGSRRMAAGGVSGGSAPACSPAGRACRDAARGSGRRRQLLHHPAGVHHRTRSQKWRDQRQVVADQHQAHAAAETRSSISRRISACTVASSALVGSSAISSSGSGASIMAIITRWPIPPESSCG